MTDGGDPACWLDRVCLSCGRLDERPAGAVAGDRHATGVSETGQEDLLEEIDNPIERLKLLSGNDDEIAKYLDAIEVTSPREREMMYEI